MDINRDLVRQKFYELTGQGTYNVDLTIYKNVSNTYVVYLKEDENTIQLLPVGTYSINKESSEIFLNYSQEDFKYFGILENIDKPTFNWLQLGALSELSAEQLNELNSNFEEFVNTVYETLQEYNPLRLTNSINKEKYVFPKLKVGDTLIMGEDGLYPFDLEEVYRKYEAIFTDYSALLSNYKNEILVHKATIERQESDINVKISETTRLQALYDDILQTLNTISIGDLSGLTTVNKGNLVEVINEINSVSEKKSEKGIANGYAPLNSSGMIPNEFLPIATKTTNGLMSFEDKKQIEKIKIYDTISDVQLDINLEIGQVIKTLGYTTKNDGLGRKFIITATDVNNLNILVNGKYASKYKETGTINLTSDSTAVTGETGTSSTQIATQENVLNNIKSNKQTCKAWVNFNGTGTVEIRSSYNVSSITDNGTGNYTINFIESLNDKNYTISNSVDTDHDAFNQFTADAIVRCIYIQESLKTVSSFKVFTGASGSGTARLDFRGINLLVFGN